METVRSQIKSKQAKTNTRKLTGLLQFLTVLPQLVVEPDLHEAPKRPDRGAAEVDIRRYVGPSGRGLNYARYGDPAGPLVLYFATSSRPEESAAWRAEMHRQALCVYAPYRPGFGGSDPLGKREDLIEALAADCSALISARPDPRAPVVLAGHREGGILAARIASELAEAHRVRGVALLSTGAPMTDWSMLDHISPPARRSLWAAQKAPAALKLGYTAAAKLFRSSASGREQLVRFFTQDNPQDAALLADPDIFDQVAADIAYCFEDCGRIVDDMALWSSEWAAPPWGPTPIRWHFIHGAAHDFHPVRSIEALCKDRPRTGVCVVDDIGQLMLLHAPHRCVSEIA